MSRLTSWLSHDDFDNSLLPLWPESSVMNDHSRSNACGSTTRKVLWVAFGIFLIGSTAFVLFLSRPAWIEPPPGYEALVQPTRPVKPLADHAPDDPYHEWYHLLEDIEKWDGSATAAAAAVQPGFVSNDQHEWRPWETDEESAVGYRGGSTQQRAEERGRAQEEEHRFQRAMAAYSDAMQPLVDRYIVMASTTAPVRQPSVMSVDDFARTPDLAAVRMLSLQVCARAFRAYGEGRIRQAESHLAAAFHLAASCENGSWLGYMIGKVAEDPTHSLTEALLR